MLGLLPIVLYISVELLPILLIIPLLLLVRRVATGRFVPATTVNGALWLLLLMAGVSLYATYDIGVSLRKVVGLAYGLFLFWALVQHTERRPQHLWGTIGLFILSGWGVVGLALVAGNLQAKVPLLFPLMERIFSLYTFLPPIARVINPNEIGGALTWLVPFTLVLLYGLLFYPSSSDSAGRQAALLAGVTVSAFVFSGLLILTQSRSALLGTAIALLLVGVLLGRWPRRMTVAGLALSLLLGGVWGISTGPADAWVRLGTLSGVTLNPVGVPQDGIYSLSGRIEIWSRAIYGLQDFPFTGMGMNTFRRIVHVLYPLFSVSPDTDIAHAHNHLLQAGLDLGLPGLIAYLALWFGLAAILVRTWRNSQEGSWPRLLTLGIGSSLLAYFIYGITDAIALGARPGFIFWMLAALAVSLSRGKFSLE